MRAWAEIHKYGLTILAHSTLRLPRGVKANLRRGRVLVFTVEPTRRARSGAAHENPATAFTLCAVKLVEAEHAPSLPGHESLELSRLAAEFDEPGFRGDSGMHTTPAGYVPVCFELGAAFVCADLALAPEPRPDHAAYVASWLKVLRGDKRAIFTAAAKAQQAADWMHARQDAADQAKAGQSRAA